MSYLAVGIMTNNSEKFITTEKKSNMPFSKLLYIKKTDS